MATAAVVTPHFLATAAGIDILSIGGSAIDAAIAANAVLGVVAPETCGIGGDLFALVFEPGQEEPTALNASGHSGSNASSDALRHQGLVEMPVMGPETVTIPGCVDGWFALAARFGHLAWSERLAPALRYADSGFPVSNELARSLLLRFEQLAPQSIGRHLLPNGRPPQPGETIARPDLAATLRTVAAGTRDAFYLGAPGAAIGEAVDGLISLEDLASNQAEWVKPLGVQVFGLDAWTIPPNSQGYLTLASAAVYESWKTGAQTDELTDVDRWHLAIEAYRSQVADRDLVLADPAHVPFPAPELLAPARLSPRLDLASRQNFRETKRAPGGTAFLCVLDQGGVGVSFIQSNYMGLGSSVGAGSAGFVLQNRGAGFNLEPGHPNELGPGKRPLHTLAPSLWTQGGNLHTILGTRGADYQPQLLLQMAIRMFDLGDSPAEAQTQPRWVVEEVDDSDGAIRVEETTPAEIVNGLRERGHPVEVATGVQGGWGPVSVIRAGPAVEAAADPRVGTAAAETL